MNSNKMKWKKLIEKEKNPEKPNKQADISKWWGGNEELNKYEL